MKKDDLINTTILAIIIYCIIHVIFKFMFIVAVNDGALNHVAQMQTSYEITEYRIKSMNKVADEMTNSMKIIKADLRQLN